MSTYYMCIIISIYIFSWKRLVRDYTVILSRFIMLHTLYWKPSLAWKSICSGAPKLTIFFPLPEEGSPTEKLKFMLGKKKIKLGIWHLSVVVVTSKRLHDALLLMFNVELHLVLYIITGLHLSFWWYGNFKSTYRGSEHCHLLPHRRNTTVYILPEYGSSLYVLLLWP